MYFIFDAFTANTKYGMKVIKIQFRINVDNNKVH